MRVLLVRPRSGNLFARLNMIQFEPLELEYLAAAVLELNHEYSIYDGLIERTCFSQCLSAYRPDVVAITGYTIHVNSIKKYADAVKKHNPNVLVIVGGVHAELNWQDFYHPGIDVVVHANPFQAFKSILQAWAGGQNLTDLTNICVNSNGRWRKTEAGMMNPDEMSAPDRSHLLAHKKKFRYFGREECALVKTAWGCNHNCAFCYCARLNGGKYRTRDLNKVIEEIKALPQDKIFIIDDNFLVHAARVINFCRLIHKNSIKKNFSIYGRADFICAHEDLLPVLKRAGVQEIIVGLESVDDNTLQRYNKEVSTELNYRAIDLLRKHGIDSCALFIVDHHYSTQDFNRLARTINIIKPDICMFSIFTPLKGLPGYETYKDQLMVPKDRYEVMDFIHLTVTPEKMSTGRFYYEFYKLYFMLLTDRKRLKVIFTPLVRSIGHLVKEIALEGCSKLLRPRQCR